MRATTSTRPTTRALRTACVAIAAVLGLSLLAVVEQQVTAPVTSTVAAEGPIIDDIHEWDSRG
ncbi:hypothetical protein EAO70_36295 [Streptomyces sp. adm13(2018)]|uniref:DUF4179 domain-containing protein n=1 Tax=unclassified Streptomyces TaxID=2593676 RepID=UPI0011CE814C|nr:DUF4179 domain-containing protein [Streptomyces sp. adm13(2018)]TXS07074.1 hypothetical protein EAO70_36295 [Streptomyces sp. adm13(2018)]